MENNVFENTINDINGMFVEAEKMSCGRYCEGCLGCLTAYLVFFCMETHYEQASSCVLGALETTDRGVKARINIELDFNHHVTKNRPISLLNFKKNLKISSVCCLVLCQVFSFYMCRSSGQQYHIFCNADIFGFADDEESDKVCG